MNLTTDDLKRDWLFFPKRWAWARKPIQDTLKMFDENPKTDPRSTPYYNASMQMVSRGTWWYGAKTDEDCVRRTLYLVDLERDIKEHGILEPITIQIKNNGKIWIHDGYHRLFCADYIGYAKPIPVRIESVAEGFQALERQILRRTKGKRVTYHPLYEESSALYHPYFGDWQAWRTDCHVRLQGILSKLEGAKTILDIGPCEGYFSINLAAKGYKVTSVELVRERAAILRFFANLREVNPDLIVKDWRAYCDGSDGEFDAILFMGTFHHQLINSRSTDEFEKLRLLKGKRLFFEMATNRDPRMKEFPTMSNQEIIRKVLENTRFTKWEKAYKSQNPSRSDGFVFT